MADFYGAGNGRSFWPDAPANKKPPISASKSADTEINVAPSANQQPPTLVQPLIVVPYSSQMQPLYQYTPEAMNSFYGEAPGAYGDAYDRNCGGYGEESESVYDSYEGKAAGKKVNVNAVLAFILSVISFAVMVVSYFTELEFIYIIKDAGALQIIIGLPVLFYASVEIIELICPIGLAVCALFTVLTLFVNLFSVKAARYPVAGKIFAVLAFVGAAVMLAMLFVTKKDIAIGAYILTGLSAVTAVVALTGRRKAQ